VRVVFIARHYSYLRLFESAVIALAERGHEVVLAADRVETMGGRRMVERIASAYPNVTTCDAPGRYTGAWAEVARQLRLGLDYLRFLEPQYVDTPHLRQRSRERAPRAVTWLAESPLGALVGGRRGLAAMLGAAERGLPISPAMRQFLLDRRPDVLLITPLIDIGSPQLDHFAAARSQGVRTVLPVGSWDHLSSKALLRAVPDRVVVWNQIQRQEALVLHRLPPDKVVVTGAQCYDQWFDRQPSRGRAEFCARVGLDPERPFVLYTCSSLFRGTVDEPAIVDAWIRALRASDDPRLKGIGILIRPHPARFDEWRGIDLSGHKNLVFWGAHPVDAEAKDDYFDSMYYSAAVVGINTSAFIEAAVVGKPVHTVLLPEVSRDNQEGTLHFRYLLNVNGGLLRVARSFEEHLSLLAESLAPAGGGDPKADRFVEGFVRPFGRGEAATPRFVMAIEEAAALPAPARERRSAGAWLAFLVMYPLAALLALHLRSQPWRKRTRHRLAKQWERQRTLALRRIKQFAIDHLGAAGKQRKSATAVGGSALTPKTGRQRDPAKTLAGTDLREARYARELVTVMGRSGRPIIVGPWLSETGFELLYWIPFVAWAKAYGNFDPSRLVVVSRGGTASWYGHITANYQEIFSFYTPEEFRVRNEGRIDEQEGRQKHLEISSFDREIIGRVESKLGLRGAEVLHPSLMYQLFDHYWYQRTPVTLVEAFTSFEPLTTPTGADIRRRLPDRYVAAKFYGNAALPSTPENARFVASYLADLARSNVVVLLNTAQRFDEHTDFPKELLGRVHAIDHLMEPAHNLAVQTEVIRNAEAFVGTYGGFSYLAPLCGVNTVAFYSHPNGFRVDHLEVAKRVFSALKVGTFTELDLRAVDSLRLGLAGSLPVPTGTHR
jgi:hypothetical protein